MIPEDKLKLYYKRETGLDVNETVLSVSRIRGKWIVECVDDEYLEGKDLDEEIMTRMGNAREISFPNADFRRWVYETLIEKLEL
jgi:hypothetical protein